jgi:hypothetical protein
VTLTAFISPYRADRDQVRALVPAGEFIEVFIDTPLDVCEQRDPKGLYKKARAGPDPRVHGHQRSLRGAGEARARREVGGPDRRGVGRGGDQLPGVEGLRSEK